MALLKYFFNLWTYLWLSMAYNFTETNDVDGIASIYKKIQEKENGNLC